MVVITTRGILRHIHHWSVRCSSVDFHRRVLYVVALPINSNIKVRWLHLFSANVNYLVQLTA